MSAEKIKLKFVFDNKEKVIDSEVGKTILEVAEENDIPLYGACEGNCACGTCHVVVDEKSFDKLDELEECEEDVLDKIPGLSHFSRLGCQVHLTKELDGMVIVIPSQNRNFVRG